MTLIQQSYFFLGFTGPLLPSKTKFEKPDIIKISTCRVCSYETVECFAEFSLFLKSKTTIYLANWKHFRNSERVKPISLLTKNIGNVA